MDKFYKNQLILSEVIARYASNRQTDKLQRVELKMRTLFGRSIKIIQNLECCQDTYRDQINKISHNSSLLRHTL